MQELTADIRITLTLRIKDDSFVPGRVRVHLPAPINASQLKEGQLLDTDPFFRMASVEDYPQRSVWYNEVLEHNCDFTVTYAFTNTVPCITPDLKLVNGTAQPGFTAEQLAAFAASRDCDCGSYTGPLADRVTMMDLSEEKYISFGRDGSAASGGSVPAPDFAAMPYGDRIAAIFSYCASADISGSRNLEFVRLCRKNGIPARWQGGILCSSVTLREHVSGFSSRQTSGSPDPCPHDSADNVPVIPCDWALAYAAPYGWFFVDAEAAAVTDPENAASSFWFGGLDPYRMPTASKYGAGLYPAKDFIRADELTNIYGEAEYVDRGLRADEYSTSVSYSC